MQTFVNRSVLQRTPHPTTPRLGPIFGRLWLRREFDGTQGEGRRRRWRGPSGWRDGDRREKNRAIVEWTRGGAPIAFGMVWRADRRAVIDRRRRRRLSRDRDAKSESHKRATQTDVTHVYGAFGISDCGVELYFYKRARDGVSARWRLAKPPRCPADATPLDLERTVGRFAFRFFLFRRGRAVSLKCIVPVRNGSLRPPPFSSMNDYYNNNNHQRYYYYYLLSSHELSGTCSRIPGPPRSVVVTIIINIAAASTSWPRHNTTIAAAAAWVIPSSSAVRRSAAAVAAPPTHHPPSPPVSTPRRRVPTPVTVRSPSTNVCVTNTAPSF